MNPQIKQAKLETLEAIIKELEGLEENPPLNWIPEQVKKDLTLLKNER